MRVQRQVSNTLWTPFDNAQRRLTSCEGYIVRHYRLRQPFQRQRPDFFKRRCPFDRHGDALAQQYLSVLGLGTQPCRNVADGANRGVPDRSAKPICPRVA